MYRKTTADFEEEKTDKIFNKGADFIIKNEKNLFALIDHSVYKFGISSTSPEKINIKYSFNKNLASEFNQMYEEAWAGVEENFYD